MRPSHLRYGLIAILALSFVSACGRKGTPPHAPSAPQPVWSSPDRQTTRMEYEAQLQIMEELGLAFENVADKSGAMSVRWKDESRLKDETVAQFYAADRFVELATEYWVRFEAEKDQPATPHQKMMDLTHAESELLAARIELVLQYLDRLKKDPDSYPVTVSMFKASRAISAR